MQIIVPLPMFVKFRMYASMSNFICHFKSTILSKKGIGTNLVLPTIILEFNMKIVVIPVVMLKA